MPSLSLALALALALVLTSLLPLTSPIHPLPVLDPFAPKKDGAKKGHQASAPPAAPAAPRPWLQVAQPPQVLHPHERAPLYRANHTHDSTWLAAPPHQHTSEELSKETSRPYLQRPPEPAAPAPAPARARPQEPLVQTGRAGVFHERMVVSLPLEKFGEGRKGMGGWVGLVGVPCS